MMDERIDDLYTILPVYRHFDIRWSDGNVAAVIHSVLQDRYGVVEYKVIGNNITRVYYRDGVSAEDIERRIRRALRVYLEAADGEAEVPT